MPESHVMSLFNGGYSLLRSSNSKIRSGGQLVNWSIRIACVMDAGRSEVVESGQNTIVVGDLTSLEESVREEDVPGASLNGRKPEQLKVPELKYWLSCRGAPTKGRKADLVVR